METSESDDAAVEDAAGAEEDAGVPVVEEAVCVSAAGELLDACGADELDGCEAGELLDAWGAVELAAAGGADDAALLWAWDEGTAAAAELLA